MPIFEIEKDGKVFEVDAPDMNAAASSLGGGAPQQPQAAPQQAAPLGQSPFRGGVRGERTLSGESIAPITPVPSMSQLAGDYGSIAKGGAIGAISGVPGMPGDIESLGRLPLSLLGVSRETVLPTSEQVGNMIAGKPSNAYEATARGVGTMASPWGYSKLLKGADKLGGFLLQQSAGVTTGAGAPAITGAYQAGREGGRAADAFLGHMRGNIASDDAVRLAKDAIAEMRAEKSAAYRAGIGSTIKGDPAILDFQPIEDAINKAANVKMFKGQSLSGMADKARQRVSEVIAEWKALPADEFHTPEGLDALKQKLSDLIYEGDLASVKPHTPASIIVNNAYNAVKDQIVKQAPGYADVMADYTKASDQLREVERTFSLGNKATADTGLRKLQSILRNNANTNYGSRVKLGGALAERSPDLMPSLAGQALNEWTPRGIQRGVAGIGTGIGYGVGGIPGAAGYAAASSPRLVGEAAFALGNARRAGAGLANTLQKAVIPGGGAGIPSIAGLSPQMLAAMSPTALAQLLASQNASR